MKSRLLGLFIFTFDLMSTVFAQMPPHPNGGGGPGGGNTPVGGAASIGGGIIILVSLAVGYGARKIYDLRKEGKEKLS